MKIKFLMLLTILLVSTVVANAALVVPENKIEVNGDYYENNENALLEKGDTVTVKVKLYNNGPNTEEGVNDLKNIVVTADILGYEYDSDSLSDQTDSFDLDEMDTVYKTLKLKIPENADKDYYDLRVRAGGRSGALLDYNVELHIKGSRHNLAIKDVVLSPENDVKKYLTATVRVKNYGEKDEEGIKVTVAIPELGVSESDYIDELEADESTTSEELLLRVPSNAEEGEYTVKTTLSYDEGTEVETREDKITVSEGVLSAAEEKTVINVGLESQSLKAGEATVYPLMITNTASTAKTYTVSVSGVAGWGSAVVQPSNVVTVAGGETSTVSVSLSVNSGASSGEKAFVVEVKSPTKSAQIPLKAVVDGKTSSSTWSKLKTVLEVGLIVLVVLLVIIGLIIGFNRLKGDEEEEEKTYY